MCHDLLLLFTSLPDSIDIPIDNIYKYDTKSPQYTYYLAILIWSLRESTQNELSVTLRIQLLLLLPKLS